MLPFATGTFFPFTSLFRTPSFAPQRPYGYRSSRSPSSNLIPIQSPLLGLRVLIPRDLLNLFNVRPPIGPEPNYPRPNLFNPPHPNFPHEHQPDGFPTPIRPFYLPPQYTPNFSPNYSPLDAGSFINFMRALYPDMIYRPDARYPNVFAIRFPEHSHLPEPRPPPQAPTEFNPDHNRFFVGEIPNPSSINEFLEPPTIPQNHPPQYNQSPQNQQPQNRLIIIR